MRGIKYRYPHSWGIHKTVSDGDIHCSRRKMKTSCHFLPQSCMDYVPIVALLKHYLFFSPRFFYYSHRNAMKSLRNIIISISPMVTMSTCLSITWIIAISSSKIPIKNPRINTFSHHIIILLYHYSHMILPYDFTIAVPFYHYHAIIIPLLYSKNNTHTHEHPIILLVDYIQCQYTKFYIPLIFPHHWNHY